MGTSHSRQPTCRCCHRGRPLSLWPSGPAATDSCSGDSAGGNSRTKPRRSAPASSAGPLPTAAFISRRASRDSPGRPATWRQQGDAGTFDTCAHAGSCPPTRRQLLHVTSSAQTSGPYQQALLVSSLGPLQHRDSWRNCSPGGNHWLVWIAQAVSMCNDAEPCSQSWQPGCSRLHCRRAALSCRGYCP